jgi:hypothetical protein
MVKEGKSIGTFIVFDPGVALIITWPGCKDRYSIGDGLVTADSGIDNKVATEPSRLASGICWMPEYWRQWDLDRVDDQVKLPSE